MNFRERFEAWHRATFKYCTPPKAGFTAFNCTYPDGEQQCRWEGWQANNVDSYQLGYDAAMLKVKKP